MFSHGCNGGLPGPVWECPSFDEDVSECPLFHSLLDPLHIAVVASKPRSLVNLWAPLIVPCADCHKKWCLCQINHYHAGYPPDGRYVNSPHDTIHPPFWRLA